MVKHSLKPGATVSIMSLQDPCMTPFQVCPGAAVNPVSLSYGQGLFRSRSTFLMSPDSRGFVANSSHALALLEQSPSALSNSNYPAHPRHIPTHTVCLTTNTARPGPFSSFQSPVHWKSSLLIHLLCALSFFLPPYLGTDLGQHCLLHEVTWQKTKAPARVRETCGANQHSANQQGSQPINSDGGKQPASCSLPGPPAAIPEAGSSVELLPP